MIGWMLISRSSSSSIDDDLAGKEGTVMVEQAFEASCVKSRGGTEGEASSIFSKGKICVFETSVNFF